MYRVTYGARQPTLNSLALRQVVILVLGKEACLVSPYNALQKPSRDLLPSKQSLMWVIRASTQVRFLTSRQVIEASSYLTIESFVQKIASIACFLENADVVTVRMEKPSAIVMAHSSGVEITRNRAFFNNASWWKGKKILEIYMYWRDTSTLEQSMWWKMYFATNGYELWLQVVTNQPLLTNVCSFLCSKFPRDGVSHVTPNKSCRVYFQCDFFTCLYPPFLQALPCETLRR